MQNMSDVHMFDEELLPLKIKETKGTIKVMPQIPLPTAAAKIEKEHKGISRTKV